MKKHNRIKLNQTLKANKITDLKIFKNTIIAGFLFFCEGIQDYISDKIEAMLEVISSIVVILLCVVLSPILIIIFIIYYIFRFKEMKLYCYAKIKRKEAKK